MFNKNYLKAKWTECPNRKTQGERLDLKKKKKRAYNMLSTRDSPQGKDTYKWKIRGWKKIFHANGQDRKAGIAILTSDKILFKTKAMKIHKERH